MHRREQSPTSLFRTIFLVAIVIFIVAAAAIPAFAQNSVPPTAVQAAKMPQYASRLAHPARRVSPPKSQVFARATKHRGPLDPGDIYDNGPINGNTDAWTINFGFIVSDSFTVANDQTLITGMSFGAWLFSGDTLTSVEVSITSGENSGTSYFDQTVNFTQGSCTSNQYGYNVCSETTFVQWSHAECGNLLGESAERQRSQRRSGLLGREFRGGMHGNGMSIAGVGEFGRVDPFGGVHHSGQRDHDHHHHQQLQ